MRRRALLACFLGTFGLAGCDVDGGGLDRARQSFGVANPTPAAFHVCGSHNCRKRVAVSLSPAEWSSVRTPLRSRPRNAGAERRALAETLRRLEVMVGRKTGYDSDRAGSTLQMGVKAQDCVDEMVNTAVYLKMLDDAAFFAANSLEPETFVLTSSFTTYLTRPITSGHLTAVGSVVHQSRSQFIAEAVARDDQGRVIARGNGIFVRGATPLNQAMGYAAPVDA